MARTNVIVSTDQNPKYGTGVDVATLVNAGSGYVATEVLTLNAGDTNATVTVDTVDADFVDDDSINNLLNEINKLDL